MRPEVERWILFIKEQKILLKIAAVVDYEARRNYLLEELSESVHKLNSYRRTKQFLELTLTDLDEAAYLWALMRENSQPSGQGLDKDVIFAAQALSQIPYFDQVIIVTTNSKDFMFHTRRGLYIWDWKQALSDCKYEEINFCYSPNI